jgi:translation initiation factor 1 (eIF-1/SUI1)
MSGASWSVEGTKKGSLPLSIEKRPCGKMVTVISNVTHPDKLLTELQSMLGAGGSVKGNAIEVQGEHTARVTKYLLAHRSQLSKVAGCKEKDSGKEGKAGGTSGSAIAAPQNPVPSQGVSKEDDRRESGKPRWSAARVAAAQAARDRSARAALGAPPGWDDDPRRCPFNWIYCSGVCTTQTMEEFARRKQQVNRPSAP